MKYIANVGLTYPVGAKNIKYAQDGQLDKVTKWRNVAPGELVEDIPECSVDWLLRAGKIKDADNVVELHGKQPKDEVA